MVASVETIIKVGGIPYSKEEYDQIKSNSENGDEKAIKEFEEIQAMIEAWRAKYGDVNVDESGDKGEDKKGGKESQDEKQAEMISKEPVPGGGEIRKLKFPNGKEIYGYSGEDGKFETLSPHMIEAERIKDKKGQAESDAYMSEALAARFGSAKGSAVLGALNKTLNKEKAANNNTNENAQQQNRGKNRESLER
ncbi:MAG: hypothetical protein LBL47_02815 [Lactobacillus sp.]|jgi:hypothetical protein|nr:hypothetical protein [Lactobacillus sp.]